MVQNQDFKEFIQSLNDHNVQYLVVGGYAVAFHGHPRYTKDMDIWVWVDQQNAENIILALEQFGMGSLNLEAHDFLEPGTIIQLGYPPHRIDILIGLKGIDFQVCYQNKIEEVIDGIKINFIDLENLKKTKRIAGRAQDLADIENLQ